MRRSYREQIFECGNYMDVQIYPVFKKARGTRKKAFNPTSEVQEKLNAKNSANYLSRLINLNFTKKDYELHLVYDDCFLPNSPERAEKDVVNFLRRAKRLYEKHGVELKYIHGTEVGEKSGRLHHHITISGGVSRDALENLWKFGFANTKALKFKKTGAAGLAHYVTKQKLLKRRFSCSKNLKRPEPKERTGRISHRTLDFWKTFFQSESDFKPEIEKFYPGYSLCTIPDIEENDVNGGIYTYVRLIKNEFLKEIEDSGIGKSKDMLERGNPELMVNRFKAMRIKEA